MSKPHLYVLKGRTPVALEGDDILAWGAAFADTAARTVAQTVIDDVKVSTMFLGLDHSFSSTGAPILFETMIFGGKHDEYQTRSSTWEEAERDHAAAVAKVEASLHS